MSIYSLMIILASCIALYLLVDILVKRNRSQEESSAKWQDIWSDRLKNGR